MSEDLEGKIRTNGLDRQMFQRGDTHFMFNLTRRIATEEIEEGIRQLLLALEERGFVDGRVYKYSEETQECILIDSLGLDYTGKEKPRFDASNQILSEVGIFGSDPERMTIKVYKTISSELVQGDDDPLRHLLRESGSNPLGLVVVPYFSLLENKQIKGVIAANFNPASKQVTPEEITMLEYISLLVGLNVRGQIKAMMDFSGVYNKSVFYENRERFWQRFREKGEDYELAILDMDYLKRWNDEHGHRAGDEMLKELAGCLREAVNGRGRGYRIGGDEFAMLVGRTSKEEFSSLIGEIREKMRAFGQQHFGQDITLSIGVSAASDGNFSCPRGWYDAADIALYTAKKGGRDGVRFYSDLGRKDDKQ